MKNYTLAKIVDQMKIRYLKHLYILKFKIKTELNFSPIKRVLSELSESIECVRVKKIIHKVLITLDINEDDDNVELVKCEISHFHLLTIIDRLALKPFSI